MNTASNELNGEIVKAMQAKVKQGETIAEIISFIRSSLGDRASTIGLLRYFVEAFHLTLREARMIEAAPCMGGEAVGDKELDQHLRPIVIQRLNEEPSNRAQY